MTSKQSVKKGENKSDLEPMLSSLEAPVKSFHYSYSAHRKASNRCFMQYLCRLHLLYLHNSNQACNQKWVCYVYICMYQHASLRGVWEKGTGSHCKSVACISLWCLIHALGPGHVYLFDVWYIVTGYGMYISLMSDTAIVLQARPNQPRDGLLSVSCKGLVAFGRFLCATLWLLRRQHDWLWSHNWANLDMWNCWIRRALWLPTLTLIAPT